MAMPRLVIDCIFTDLPLLKSTLADYQSKVENGEMDDEEATENAIAMAIGMVRLRERD